MGIDNDSQASIVGLRRAPYDRELNSWVALVERLSSVLIESVGLLRDLESTPARRLSNPFLLKPLR